ncbi:MAG TPA: CDGSH iron-sulfur domain-containing protein [Steroidobacteraceae bacterium]|nr:CDGSH iron-sulfur domain-containing protein [Steroidobacteraceae bacterium]HQW07720.1 CDGSH iron-sulfur domain-containing protein [Steroidobacteraceae bacterium]HQX78609.1 CDGSH iron-sulfur domain-containing protein [Steroidobacteraceae bacterium]HQZ80460.1 CDGSH iron-sulfur domain-containing protein [Steroidobacteraceae bacterium]
MGDRFQDDGASKAAPEVNTVRVLEHGPLAFHAQMHFHGGDSAMRATLCRCGSSQAKPFCDTSHVAAGFTATGEPPGESPGEQSPALAVRNGPLEVIPVENGPLHVKGNLEIVTATGCLVKRVTECWLCRCGHAGKKPFCDGTHRKIGFTAPGLPPVRK